MLFQVLIGMATTITMATHDKMLLIVYGIIYYHRTSQTMSSDWSDFLLTGEIKQIAILCILKHGFQINNIFKTIPKGKKLHSFNFCQIMLAGTSHFFFFNNK